MKNSLFDFARIAVIPIIVSSVVAYLTARYAVRREQRYGKLRLIELCRRYVINLTNAIDPITHTVKSRALDREMYVAELDTITRQLEELTHNDYFGKLISQYSEVSLLLVSLRRELVEHRSKKVLKAINFSTLRSVSDLYHRIKADLPRKSTESTIDHVIVEFLDANKDVIARNRLRDTRRRTEYA